MSMGNEDVGFEDLAETDILRPKAVARHPAELTQDGHYGGNVSGPVRVSRVTGDAYETVFGNCTSRPGLVSLFRKPAMGRFMMDVHRIGKGKQQIDVEKAECILKCLRMQHGPPIVTPAKAWARDRQRVLDGTAAMLTISGSQEAVNEKSPFDVYDERLPAFL